MEILWYFATEGWTKSDSTDAYYKLETASDQDFVSLGHHELVISELYTSRATEPWNKGTDQVDNLDKSEYECKSCIQLVIQPSYSEIVINIW